MDRRRITEILGTTLVAFAIAMVINFFRVLIFQDGNFREAFLGINTANTTNNSAVNTTATEQQNQITSKNLPAINTNLEEVIYIPISPLKELSGLSKAEILEMRRDAVKTSPIFSDMNYTPSPEVFRIDDGMPWISMNAALNWSKATDKQKIEGVSRDSAGILNPELLYYISVSEGQKADTHYVVLYKDFDFLPYKAEYYPNTKTITVYIKNERVEHGRYQTITLADANAHDLGYKYAYMDKYKNVGFYKEKLYKNNRLNSGIKEITGWYMHGPACGIPGGCNNYAPYWQYYNQFYLDGIPASINIKLWKEKPNSPEQEADINYRMVFE